MRGTIAYDLKWEKTERERNIHHIEFNRESLTYNFYYCFYTNFVNGSKDDWSVFVIILDKATTCMQLKSF